MDRPGFYAKKRVVVLAQQYDADKAHRLQEPFRSQLCACEEVSGRGDNYKGRHIHTLEGPMFAKDGDWIVEGVHGEFYPVKHEIFMLTYEPASEGVTR